ncbi:uncharacterized protein LOC133925986 [Phragmites australis]|uniref:uncharacterized protein LOC133925986 n=1 Tax=Phragmites australis TaxID=29695 RepID=UPI002D767E4B|nr:uncharacterized protein LOC133925986 [Phragmites australis]
MGPIMIKKKHILLLALILSFSPMHAWETDWTDGASRTREYMHPNLVNSPSLPPYNDVIGPSAPAADDVPPPPPPPPPPYCVYPPPAKPALPAPLPPASPPGASPPSIAPGSPQPPPPAFLPPVAFPAPPPSPAPARPELWCVANPTVATAVVQTAMDYACGSGADCDMAAPGGPCYLPDTLMAHASYAFNSYWQRSKVTGGTCDFAGAAMLVTRDPSYDGCRYVSM